MDIRSRTQMPLMAAFASASLVAVLAIACQQAPREAETASDTAMAAPPAQSASADTPPAGESEPAASDTPMRQPDTAGAAEGGAAAGAEQRAASGDLTNGWKQYEANCSRCHGQDALGSAFAPDLRESVKGALSQEAFVQVVKDGRTAKGMPGFATQLDDQKINDIYVFVVARASGKLGPGRPSS